MQCYLKPLVLVINLAVLTILLSGCPYQHAYPIDHVPAVKWNKNYLGLFETKTELIKITPIDQFRIRISEYQSKDTNKIVSYVGYLSKIGEAFFLNRKLEQCNFCDSATIMTEAIEKFKDEELGDSAKQAKIKEFYNDNYQAINAFYQTKNYEFIRLYFNEKSIVAKEVTSYIKDSFHNSQELKSYFTKHYRIPFFYEKVQTTYKKVEK
jgi:hypothetical protein